MLYIIANIILSNNPICATLYDTFSLRFSHFNLSNDFFNGYKFSTLEGVPQCKLGSKTLRRSV